MRSAAQAKAENCWGTGWCLRWGRRSDGVVEREEEKKGVREPVWGVLCCGAATRRFGGSGGGGSGGGGSARFSAARSRRAASVAPVTPEFQLRLDERRHGRGSEVPILGVPILGSSTANVPRPSPRFDVLALYPLFSESSSGGRASDARRSPIGQGKGTVHLPGGGLRALLETEGVVADGAGVRSLQPLAS
ncbi:hypothetical protein TWF696_008249 [Orbilia brochopaga]|uniref:Uncharacterized protein n=1 Tax=Orbilia brochopaga TaxID=3140254 RepID=A0AAV9UKU4_9PEZI